MKMSHSFVMSVTVFACVIGLALSAPSFGAQKAPPDQSHERADLQITNIYSAKDGAATFNGYVVSWKGQEVVVSDSLAKWDYRVGDTIPVLVLRSGAELRFEINPRGKVKRA